MRQYAQRRCRNQYFVECTGAARAVVEPESPNGLHKANRRIPRCCASKERIESHEAATFRRKLGLWPAWVAARLAQGV